MRCMRCTDEALPDKALCAHCYPGWVAECKTRSRSNEKVGQERVAEIAARPNAIPAPVIARLLATLFDVSLLMTLSWAIVWPVAIFSGITPSTIAMLSEYNGDGHVLQFVDQTLYLMLKIVLCTYIIPAWTYYAVMELCPLAATPGKLLTGLRVVAANGDLTFQAVSRRFFFKLLPFLLPVGLIPGVKPVLLLVLPQWIVLILLAALALLIMLTILNIVALFVSSTHSTINDYFTNTSVFSIRQVGYSRLMLCFTLSLFNLGVHGFIWADPALKASAFELICRATSC